MAGFFYNLGKMVGPKVRKGKWVWKSLTDEPDNAVLAEYEMGLDIVAQLKTNLELVSQKEYALFVQNLGRRLSKRLKNKKLQFSFKVYRDNSPNAFAVPGGFIFVSSALIQLYDFDEDMTAFVAAHEMGHIIRRHSINRLVNSAAISTITKALPARGRVAGLLKSTGIRFFQSAYSQSQELEADLFGVKLMNAAGFKAEKSIKALENLAKCSKANTNAANEYFSTHPQTARRVENIQQAISKA